MTDAAVSGVFLRQEHPGRQNLLAAVFPSWAPVENCCKAQPPACNIPASPCQQGLLPHTLWASLGPSSPPCLQGLPASPAQPGSWAYLSACFPSADRLLDELQAIVGLLHPLAGPKVAQAMRVTVADLLQVFTSALAAAFRRYQAEDGTFTENLGEHEVCLWYCVLATGS